MVARSWNAGLLLLGVLAFACDDQRVHVTAGELGGFYVGDGEIAPDLSQFADPPAGQQLEIDFGMVDVGVVSYRYLFLRNVGNDSLRLLSLTLDADNSADFEIGCAAGGPFGSCPLVAEEALEAIPGQDLIVRVAYGPSDVGVDQGGFDLALSDHHNSSLRVSLVGQGVTPEIQVCISDCLGDQEGADCSAAADLCNDAVAPANLAIDFGDSQLGQMAERTIQVYNRGERSLQIISLDLSGGDYSQFTVAAGGFTLEPGDSRAVVVGYNPGLGGEHGSFIEIATNDVNEGEIRVELQARGLAPRLCPDPLALDFGNVPTGESDVRSFTITNCGLLDLDIDQLNLSSDSSADFSLGDTSSISDPLEPGATLAIDVTYQPAQPGSDSGGVELYSNDPASDPVSGLTGIVSLRGESVPRACDIQATPFVVNFGGVIQNELGQVDLILSNQGTDLCTLHSVEISQNTADMEFLILQAPAAETTFHPGETLVVSVQYAPVDLGIDVGILSLFGDDKDSDELLVDLNGEGIAEAVCDVEITPANVWFGAVKVYNSKSMVVQLKNQGLASCNLTSLELPQIVMFAEDFSITSAPSLPFVLNPRGQPGSEVEIEITMAPPDPSFLQVTTLTIGIDDDDLGDRACTDDQGNPLHHQACLMVSGFAKYSDVEVVPADLDFGLVTLGCNSPERCVTVYNLGSQNLDVTAIGLEDSADPNFEIRSAPMLPHSLIAGGDFQVCLRYTPQDLSVHRNALVIEVDGDETIVPVFGRGTDSSDQTDVFHQPTQVKSDVLFVVDCSGSMSNDQQNLADNFGSFIAQATSMDVDFHLGVVATEVEDMPGFTGTPPRQVTPGHLVQAGSAPRIITSLTPNMADAFTDNVSLGDDCSNHEAGLQGAWLALSEPNVSDPNINAGFLREDAKLYIIVLSDEQDQSVSTVDFYFDFFSSLKGYRNTEMMSVSAICGDCSAGRYWDITQRTGGICESIDTADWAQALAGLGIDAFSAIREFPLSRPADPGSIVVTVDGVALGQATSQGGADGWSYFGDSNTIFFGDGVVPERGDRIEVSYTATCL